MKGWNHYTFIRILLDQGQNVCVVKWLMNGMQGMRSQTVKSLFEMRASSQAVKQQIWWSKNLTDGQGHDYNISWSDHPLLLVVTVQLYLQHWDGTPKMIMGLHINILTRTVNTESGLWIPSMHTSPAMHLGVQFSCSKHDCLSSPKYISV